MYIFNKIEDIDSTKRIITKFGKFTKNIVYYKCDLCGEYKDDDEYAHYLNGVDDLYTKACICAECNYQHSKLFYHIYYNYWKDKLNCECAKCGYSLRYSILEYHHVNNISKVFNVYTCIKARSISRIIREIDKCCLLCQTCHKEYELGEWTAKFKKESFGYSLIKPSIIYKK